MAINAYFFDSVNGDRKYSAGDFAKAFGIILQDGMIGSGFVYSIANKTLTGGKATIQGHFVEMDATEDLTTKIPAGTYTGKIILRLDATQNREVTVEVLNTTTLTQNSDVWELPLYTIDVTNGAITTATGVATVGGAVTAIPENVVTWNVDPHGVYLDLGTDALGNKHQLFLTSAQPGAGGTGVRRTWIQTDA